MEQQEALAEVAGLEEFAREIIDDQAVVPMPDVSPAALSAASVALMSAWLLIACGGGGGGGGGLAPGAELPGGGGTAPAQPATEARPSALDAARFLTQGSFGATSIEEIEALRVDGFERWLWNQFNAPTQLHTAYLDAQRTRDGKDRATDEMSYEAVWQQWLHGADQLRGRVAFALSEIVVVSNIAPDLRPFAMSSYMDLLNRNAFGNYRTLLGEVTLHPTMGYYLNMLESEKDDAAKGIHPNENYAREVLQLFSIGLVELNIDGTAKASGGKPIPTFGEAEVKGFAKAFSGWSFASLDAARAEQFHKGDQNLDSNWTTPMKAFASKHSSEAKKLLGSTTLPGGQSPQKDLDDALDNIFNHANVGPFIGRQLIQRLVTSNPSAGYIERVARTFNNNGAGVRGDLKAVVRAVLLDAEARSVPAQSTSYGKQREPVVRFANLLRALGAKSRSGTNRIHYLDSSDDGLGQSPLLAPSVFNFFSPNYRQPGAMSAAGLVAPEFQITTETSVVGSLNFFAQLINSEGYGGGDHKLVLDLAPLQALANDPAALVARLDLLLFAAQMGTTTRERLTRMLAAMPGGSNAHNLKKRVKAALIVTAVAPDFVIQK
ncbi:MAG TPA: DUF1800 family protein [Burkholderiaceae bacterium]|nr:DUF1800 family protein [Burkholderiaceae bacterium]